MSRKAKAMKTTSIFARALQRLLDETEFYSRAEWSHFFGISEPALSQWVNDRTIPRANLLRMAIDLLETRGGVAAGEALMAFKAIMDEPAEDISPIGARFAPNLQSYLEVRALSDFNPIRQGDDEEEEEDEPILVASTVDRPKAGRDRYDVDLVAYLPDHHPHGLGPAWRAPRLVRTRAPHDRQRQVSIDEFAAFPRLVLMGAPGSGKSWFLSHFVTQHARWRDAEVVGLRGHSVDGFGDWLNMRAARAPTQPLIIDGVDEMEMDQRQHAVTLIDRFADKAPEAPILVASRPVNELERLSAFESFTIAPLSDIDLIAEVTRSSLASQSPIEVDRFLCHLTERETLRPALRNPLFLKIAWSLFENSAVTPFAEAVVVKEYMHVLLDRDHRKGFSRVREPWATSHHLLALLGEISLHLLRREEVMFDETLLAKCVANSSSKVPVRQLLDLLLVLGLLTEDDRRYSFSHSIFKEYFAARFVVESAASAVDYFKPGSKRSRMDGAMRMACSLASDATPLLETVMRNRETHANRHVLLAQMLAQPIAAQPKVLAESCHAIVGWLSEQTADWKVFEADQTASDASAKWLVCAHFGRSKETAAVAETLRAVHQARSGPAYESLRDQLSDARSSFLPIFAEAMDVEGRLNVNYVGAMPKGAARVAVETLQLA